MAPDGAYELRLTVSTGTGTPLFARVSPLRILNQIPPFAITATPLAVPTLVPNVVPTIDPNQSLPTLVPTPTAFSNTPEAVAVTTHAAPFASVVETEQVFGVQFHPEKSGTAGVRMLRNFVTLCSPNG